jgi:NitT/TauT family transport system substrate-binding protein
MTGNRKFPSPLATVLAALLLSAHVMPAFAADDYAVKIAYGASLCHAPLHVAIEKGFFESEGLKFEAAQYDTAATAEAAATGHIDAGYGLVGKFAQPIENGLPIQLVAGIHTGCIKILTRGDSPISSVAGLKGKKIGVASLADSPALITRRALSAQGIGVASDNLEVDFVVFNNADLPQALANGAIDAYAASDPAASVAQDKNGLKQLLSTATDEPFASEYCCVTFVTSKFAREHPGLAEKYTRAVMRASLWVEQNPEEAARIQTEKNYVAGDADFNAKILASYNYRPSTQGGYDALKNTYAALREIGILKKGTDTEALLKKSYLFFENFDEPREP